MTASVRLHLDDRGVARALVEHWIPYLDIDVVWLVDLDGDDELLRDVVPFVPLSPLALPSVLAEARQEGARVLALFGSVSALLDAAQVGLPPDRVVIQHMSGSPGAARLSPEVFVDETTLEQLRQLAHGGFTFDIRPLPVVTARTWNPLAL